MSLCVNHFLRGQNRSKYKHSLKTEKTTPVTPDTAVRELAWKLFHPLPLYLHFQSTIFASIYPFSVAFQGGTLWSPIADRILLL